MTAASRLPIQDDLDPQFAFSLFVPGDGDRGAVDMTLHTLKPDIRRHASMALLYGLALMTLDQQGVIAETIDALLKDGPINEVDACNRISLLMDQ